MLSPEPPQNLFAMRNALINYLGPVVDYYYELLDWPLIGLALWTWDYEALKQARDAIIDETEAERQELTRKLYEHEG